MVTAAAVLVRPDNLACVVDAVCKGAASSQRIVERGVGAAAGVIEKAVGAARVGVPPDDLARGVDPLCVR